VVKVLVGGGVIAAATGVTVVAVSGDVGDGAWFWIGGETMFFAGLVALPGGFDTLADYYDSARASGLPPAAVRDAVEHVWLVAARSEHSRRRGIGGLGILAGTARRVRCVRRTTGRRSPRPRRGAVFWPLR
jgi:hypothetical protein